jgi:hypothetical protein
LVDGLQETNLRWRLDFFGHVDGIFVHSTLALKIVFPGPGRNIGSKIKTREIIEENER